MPKHFNLLLLIPAFAFALFSYSCRELVQSDFPDFKPVPTVNSIFRADSILKVHVSLASKMDTIELQGLDNAEVKLWVDDEFKEMLIPVGNGLYASTTKVEPTKKYECRVLVPGYNVVTCSSVIPKPSRLLGIEHVSVAGKDEEGITYPAIKFTFSNNPAEKLYFEARLRLITHNSERIPELLYIVDPVLLNEGLPLAVFSNQLITDTAYTMTMNYTTGSFGSSNGGPWITELFPLIIEIRSISYDYYQYMRQKYMYETGRYPAFGLGATQAFSLYSNVKNGYGIFAGYSAVISDTIKPTY